MAKRLFDHRLLAATLCFMFGALLALGFPATSAAITFSQTIPTFDFDVGIDYSALTGRLVTSAHFNTNGVPDNLEDVNPFTGARADISGFANRFEELKVATARAVTSVGCPQNAPVGTIFTSNGDAGSTILPAGSDSQVVMVSPAGGANPSGAVLATVTLPGEQSSLRGGFYFDFRCVITAARGTPGVNYLVVVSGDESPFANVGGNVWLLPINPGPSFGVPILLKTIIKPDPFNPPPATLRAHLEGVIVVPVDSKYGPWSGQIVTGDEDRRATGPIVNGASPKIYAINPSTGACLSSSNGSASPTCPTTFNISGPVPHPEDFDFIEGDFYGAAFNNSVTSSPVQGRILKAPLSDFPANPEGLSRPDILITQEYPQTPGDSTPIPVSSCNDVGVNSGLYHIRWDGSSQFVSTQLSRTGTTPTLCQWEHVTFVPVSDLTIVKTPDGNSFNVGDNINFTMVVTSVGPGTASNVVLTDPLPTPGNLTTWAVDSVSFTGLVTPAPTNASCSFPVANQLSCNLGSMAPGATVTVKVKTTTAGGANSTACTTNNGRVDNTATVTADGPISKKDTGFWLCQVGSYTLTKNPKNATYNIGDNINFTMVVTSTGPGTALNVVLNDPLPTLGNLNNWIITTNPGGVCTIVSNTLNCPFGNLANGQTRTVVVATNASGGANASACPGGVKLNNTATLTGTGLPTKTDTGDYTCTPPPTNLRTVTQGGWHASPHGNNPGTILNAYFTGHPGAQVVIGSTLNAAACPPNGGKTLTFTSANAIRAFLPAGSTPGVLAASATNPTTSAAGVFAGQVLALQLNVTLSNAGNLPGGLGSFVLTSGPAAGKTVNQVLADANKALGGCGLPSYVTTISDLNDIVDSINEKFDQG